MHDCLIAFGSNVGDRLQVFQRAIARLDRAAKIRVTNTSKPVQTAPVGGPENQEPYLNAAIRVETTLDPFELHQFLVETENDLGRQRRTRWDSRKIDLDLLLYDQRQINTDKLQVPHPRMSFRRFVLEPACEIARDMVHPPSGRTLGQLISHLDELGNLILVICPTEFEDSILAIVSQLSATESEPRYDLRLVTHLDQMRELRIMAKLVAYVRGEVRSQDEVETASNRDQDLSPLYSAALSFPGPTLELPTDQASAILEIRAAIEAMSPLQIHPVPSDNPEETGED
jgi:2-amino-4-hydroxy-6-hydroxymethyldihydropteridine diphosphokinase